MILVIARPHTVFLISYVKKRLRELKNVLSQGCAAMRLNLKRLNLNLAFLSPDFSHNDFYDHVLL